MPDQFLYDKSGRPLMVPTPQAQPAPLPAAKPLNDKCPTCGNRSTVDLPSRNTSGKSQITSKKVRCDDCDTVFEAKLETPITPKYKKPPKLGEFR